MSVGTPTGDGDATRRLLGRTLRPRSGSWRVMVRSAGEGSTAGVGGLLVKGRVESVKRGHGAGSGGTGGEVILAR
jgi:hypothetical protein